MKTLIISYLLLFGVLLPDTSKAAVWIHFSTNEYYDSFYDNKSLSRPSSGIIRVLKKEVVRSQAGKEFVIRKRMEKGLSVKGYTDFKYSLTLSDIDCQKAKFRFFYLKEYSNSGKELSSHDFPPDQASQWHSIPRDSIVDYLRKAVCK
ncbi:MAG: surface-adhesin E family protein [Thermodesulfovibrionales bacterium]